MYIITFKPENAPTHNICTLYVYTMYMFTHTPKIKNTLTKKGVNPAKLLAVNQNGKFV